MAGFLKKIVNKFKDWKPKTIAGKILKPLSAVAAVGGALVGTVASAGAIAGVIGGGGLLAGAAAGVTTAVKVVGSVGGAVGTGAKAVGGGVKKVMSKLGAGAANLITGQSKENRQIIAAAKDEVKEVNQKKSLIDKLIGLGYSEKDAMAKAGISSGSVIDQFLNNATSTDFMQQQRDDSMIIGGGKGSLNPNPQGSFSLGSMNPLLLGGLALGGILLLTGKKR